MSAEMKAHAISTRTGKCKGEFRCKLRSVPARAPPVGYASLVLLGVLTWEHPLTLVRFALAVAVVSFFYSLYFLRSERSLDFLYGVLFSYFDVLLLSWIFPYAVATVRARSWLTR